MREAEAAAASARETILRTGWRTSTRASTRFFSPSYRVVSSRSLRRANHCRAVRSSGNPRGGRLTLTPRVTDGVLRREATLGPPAGRFAQVLKRW